MPQLTHTRGRDGRTRARPSAPARPGPEPSPTTPAPEPTADPAWPEMGRLVAVLERLRAEVAGIAASGVAEAGAERVFELTAELKKVAQEVELCVARAIRDA